MDTYTIFAPNEAARIATEMNAEPGETWTYKAINNPDPDGPKTAIVRVYDEAGEFVGNL